MLKIKQHKFIWFGIIVLGLILIGVPPLYAGDVEPSDADVAYTTAVQYRMAALEKIAANRQAVIEELVSMWFVDEPGWEDEFRSALYKANSSKLLAVSEAGSYAEVQAILGGGTPDDFTIKSMATPLSIGDTDKDMVFSPVTPCTIVDTRFGGGGFISSFETRNYHVYGNLTSQGGANCPAPRGEPRAVHVSMIAVTPTTGGNLTVLPKGGSGASLSVNYTSNGANLANAGTVKTAYLTGEDITVTSRYSGCHAVLNVLGYYYNVDEDDFKVKFAGSRSGATTTLYTIGGCTNYEGGNVSIFAPGPGKITVNAQANIELTSHTAGTPDHVEVFIGTTASDCTYSNGSQGYNFMTWFVPGGHPTWSTGYEQQTIPVSRTFTVTSAGTKTYYLNANRTAGNGGMFFWWSAMQAHYYPDF